MALDRRVGNKVSKSMRREDSPAVRVDPHPYIGIVKNNLDPTRSGRLQVWIPDQGGDQDSPKNWRTVSYASPFMGTTNNAKTPDLTNSFENVPHTYGMWMVPPDIGVEVIVIFIGGDPLRGYWIGCVNSHLSRHMVPGMAGSTNIQGDTADADFKKGYVNGAVYPVVEFNENNPNAAHNPNWANNPKPVHEVQAKILRNQGLDRDDVRGAISSSSQRESPSNVFGISTPGRPLKDPADNPNFEKNLKEGKLTEADYAVKGRVGGHTFVMDDGSIIGKDQLVRLRTARGHQIMMHDSENTFYIANADGTVWIELNAEGKLDVYSENGINFRTQGSMNFHADGSMNFNAGGKFNVKSSKTQFDTGSMNLLLDSSLTIGAGGTVGIHSSGFNVESEVGISLGAKTKVITNGTILENSTSTVPVKMPTAIKLNSLADTSLDIGTGIYKITPKALSTIVTVAPSHEPYYSRRVPGTLAFFKDLKGAVESGLAVKEETNGVGTQPPATYKGSVDATKTAAGSSINRPVTEKEIRNQIDKMKIKGDIGPLNKDDLTALFAQTGKSESGGDYTTTNSRGYLGKYQMGFMALRDLGYVSSNVTSNEQLKIESNWIKGDGKPGSRDAFLNSESIQETAMYDLTATNYKYMCANGAVTKDTSKEEVAGLLSTAHLLGAGGAHTWRTTGGGSDANGTTGTDYFQRGKYSVAVWSGKVADIRNG
jgi:hypothetical protein